MAEPRIAVGVATYKRPDLLEALLESLRVTHKPTQTRILVVDNDPAGTAENIATSSGIDDLVYVIEPRPGIVAARNRFLELCVDDDFVVFVDDDEWVETDWLEKLYGCHLATAADVIAGPVIPHFPDGAPAWAVNGGFFERQRYTTGTVLGLAATNNSLVRKSAIDALALPRFDHRYSETGGSDSDLFARLSESGSQIVWCDEAIVSEMVPEARMTWKWVRQRARRTGQVRARLLLDRGRRPRVLIEGLGRVVVGSLKLASRRVRRQDADAWALNPFHRGLGMLDALRGGSLIREYKR